MPVRDHEPLTLESFLGTFDRGEDETTPTGYFKSSQNVAFANKGVFTREGSEVDLPTTFNVRRIATYKRIGEAPRLLVLTDDGRLFDSTSFLTPIYTNAAMTDFSMVSMFNRAYITPHNGQTGLPGAFVQVYDGDGAARPAGGVAPPPSGMIAAESAPAASMDSGYHVFAVAFETESGQIGPYGSYVPLILTGTNSVTLSNIPLGPAGTVARVLFSTKELIPTADFTNQTYYFIPTARIPDNVTTTKTGAFYDADLQVEASYLADQLATIPAGVGLNVYKGRLISWGEDANPSIVRVSQPGQPESFDAVEGYATINPGDSGGGVKYCFEYRTQLVCCKTQRSYITMDNGNSAALWEVNALDKSVGTECHGVGKILDFGEDVRDRAFIADRSGLQLFQGTFSDTEISSVISNIWDRINKSEFHRVEVAVDPLRARVYIAVPLDASVECSHVIVGDWSDGLNLEGMKWTLWTFPKPVSTVIVDVDTGTKKSLMKFASSTGFNINRLNDALKLDYGNAIDSWVEFPFLPQGNDYPVSHFTGFRSRVKGEGNLQISLSDLDEAQIVQVPSLPLITRPGKPLFRGFNFTSERCAVKVRMNNPGEYFNITHFTLFHKQLWQTRPE